METDDYSSVRHACTPRIDRFFDKFLKKNLKKFPKILLAEFLQNLP